MPNRKKAMLTKDAPLALTWLFVLRHKAGQEGRGEILLENSSLR